MSRSAAVSRPPRSLAERAIRYLFAAMLQYEVVAITADRDISRDQPWPTVSSICRKRRKAELAVAALWIMHIHVQFAKKAAAEAVIEAAREAAAEVAGGMLEEKLEAQ